MARKIVLNIHPFLFTIVSLLFVYFETIWETTPGEMLRPFFVLTAVVLLLYPLAVKITGGMEWGGILMSIFVLVAFFQPDAFAVTSVSSALVICLWFFYRKLTGKNFFTAQISLSLTLVGICLLVFQIAKLLPVFNSIPFSYYKSMIDRSHNSVIPLVSRGAEANPDIYYLVLDAYPRADILQELYHYDNSEFTEYLESLGFILPKDTRANYPRTALSISSTLDMQYWDTISPDMENVIVWWPTKPVLQHSRARESLEAVGYKSISFASDWDLTDNPTADIYIKPYPIQLTGYENYLAVTTPLKPLFSPLQNIAPVMSNEVHRRYILNILENLKKVPDIEGPKFIFAHILLPHPPFVFNSDGSPIDTDKEFTFAPRGLSKQQMRDGYIAHIEFLNRELRAVIESILSNSKVPPIIILQADHGPGNYFSFRSIKDSCLRDRYFIFGAYYLPDIKRDRFPDDLTPVNLFRVIFNEYFNAQMPLLENRQYFTFGHNLFAGMTEITDQVGMPQARFDKSPAPCYTPTR